MTSQPEKNGELRALQEQLTKEPHRFDFFQAVRLLRLISLAEGQERESIGEDANPQQEIVRFRALPSLRFPASTISSLAASRRGVEIPSEAQLEMVVTFMGLTGPQGVLPRHYTQLLINRIREKDFAFRDFLDLFNHRIISLFYRAWEKYQFPIVYEATALQSQQQQRGNDLFTRCLYGVSGFGIKELRNRLEVNDEAFIHYGGLFGHRPPTAVSLVRLLGDYLGLPTRVLQFQGQWLYLTKPNRSSLPTATRPNQRNNRLGRNLVIGRRVWDVQNKFRVQIGPLTYSQFRRFMPDGEQLVRVGQLVRSYVGAGYDFDVLPVLQRSEVPRCRLGDAGRIPSRLGWNTWLRSAPLAHDAEDAVFTHEGTPSR